MIKKDDIHKLKSILLQLRSVAAAEAEHSLGLEILSDNIDWLDCFIDKHERQQDKAHRS